MTTQSTIRLFAIRCLQTGLCVLLAIGLLTSAGASTAFAQSAHSPEAPAEDEATVSELVQMLASPIDAERDEALFQVTNHAYHSPDVDLTPAVPALVDIYQNDPDAVYRFAAVAALSAIGDETGMQVVRKRALQDPSLKVQYASIAALLDYYGPHVFGSDAEAVALANNVLARKQEFTRLAQVQQADPSAVRQR